ncbi:MAG TPA: hypothetical protein VGH81_10680 [Rudaea sp.]|jgi:hypothetical protein
MARPKTPTNVLELSGAFRKNPQRRRGRDGEPVPKAGIGPAPAHLSADESAAWDDIVSDSSPGVLGDSDRAYLEITAGLLALERRVGFENMDCSKLRLLSTMLGKLGLNPSDRSHVKVGGKPMSTPGRDNPFSDL